MTTGQACNETCSRLAECDVHSGGHDSECQVERNRIDGIALCDALAIAEKETDAR